MQQPQELAYRLVIAAAVAYGLYGYYYEPYLLDMFLHKPYSIERISTTLWLTTEGVFGLPLGVAATFVFVFVLFGAFLEVTGGGNFFIDLAYALTGRFSGGPAKTAVSWPRASWARCRARRWATWWPPAPSPSP